VGASPVLAFEAGLIPFSAGLTLAPAAAIGAYFVAKGGIKRASLLAGRTLDSEQYADDLPFFTFAWKDWKQQGDRYVSPSGKRTLSVEAFQRLARAVSAAKAPPVLAEIKPHDIAVDPQRFQFKLGTDAKTGTGGELKQVGVYNPDLAGVLAVWKDPADGKTYVVNGHHRLELAKRAGAPTVAVRYLSAANAQEARSKGALINIAEGRGTAIDAAKFLRDTGVGPEDLKQRGISLSGNVARDAVALKNLDEGLFHRLTLGGLDVPRAVAIAAHLPNGEEQRQLLSYIEKQEKKRGRNIAPGAVAEAAKEMAAAGRVRGAGGSAGLFDGLIDNSTDESVFIHRSELKHHIRNALGQQAKDFGLLGSKRRVGNTADAGNVIDAGKNKELSEHAKNVAAAFEASADRAGPVLDIIHAAAEELAHAPDRERNRIRQQAVGAVRKVISEGRH
jgi:hypothetical protein